MAVNIGAKKIIIFHNKAKAIKFIDLTVVHTDNEPGQDDPRLIIHLKGFQHSNHANPTWRAYKLLGIQLDEHLNLNYHNDFRSNTLTRSLFCIRRAKNLLSAQALKTLYYAFIQGEGG
jgi:hypothetical protein